MILIQVMRKAGEIEKITISGHAQSNVRGKDLVCAAVSAIAQGGLLALQHDEFPIDYDIDEGYIQIRINSYHQKVSIIIETLMIQLTALAENQPKYVTIQTNTH